MPETKPQLVKPCAYCRAPEVVDALMGLAKIAVMHHKLAYCKLGPCSHCEAMKAVNQVISDSSGCREFIARWSPSNLI